MPASVATARRERKGSGTSRLRVVETPAARPYTFATFLWIGAAAFALVLVVIVVSQVLLTQATFRTAEAERELDRVRADYERSRLEKARAESPTQIEQRARDEIGMVPAEKPSSLNMGPPGPSTPPEDGATSTGAEPPPGSR